MNKVILMGNLTRDPELKYIPSGTAVTNFNLAINRTYKNAAGEKQEEVTFVKVVVWGKMAEVCAEHLSKGRKVIVEGKLQSRSWVAEDGQKRSALDVVSENIHFLGNKNNGSNDQETIDV